MFGHDISRSNRSVAGPIADTSSLHLRFLLPARWFGRLVRRIGAVIRAGNIAWPRTLRWCDSTERELTDDLDPRGISITVD
jgi:hypothetical protein